MNRRGSILIITLWILAILSLLAISFAHHTAVGIKLTEYHISSLKNLYICKAGIKRACYELNRDKAEEEYIYDSLNDSWSNNPEAFKNAGVGDGTFTVSYQIEDDNKDMTSVYGMIDEERRLNINKLVKDGVVDGVRLSQIKKLLEIVDIDTVIADYIVDWLDSDSLGDGEEDFYQGLSVPYNCKNDLIECLEEMYLIRGITAEIFKKLKPYITIYGDGKININTAGKEVFAALGMDDTLTQQILDYRGQDGGEEDLYSFKTLESIIPNLNNYQQLTSEQRQILTALIQTEYLTVCSSVFTANVTSVLNNSKLAKKVDVVLQREEDNNIKIEYWHES
ncbi:MAG: type II secretion system protein GspK [bacterium]|nr:type II secretion system protein GspK [bacterium]